MFKDGHEAKESAVRMLEKNMVLLHPGLVNSDRFVGAFFPVPFLLTTCAFCSSLPAFVVDI